MAEHFANPVFQAGAVGLAGAGGQQAGADGQPAGAEVAGIDQQIPMDVQMGVGDLRIDQGSAPDGGAQRQTGADGASGSGAQGAELGAERATQGGAGPPPTLGHQGGEDLMVTTDPTALAIMDTVRNWQARGLLPLNLRGGGGGGAAPPLKQYPE